MPQERLQKVLAAAGVASRRKCEELIVAGHVRVNGQVVDTLPSFADPDKDRILVRNKPLPKSEKVYYLLNKPKGVVCTSRDPQGRRTAVKLVPCKQRIFCAGRLDADTTGLIILTNDNELTNRLTHPRYELMKTYVVQVKGRIEPDQIEKLKKGIWLAEGKTRPSAVKILKKGHHESLIEIRISQGLNRQIRRMLAKVGLNVKSLKRTQIGKIGIKGLGTGRYKPLSKSQVQYLYKVTQKSNARKKNR